MNRLVKIVEFKFSGENSWKFWEHARVQRSNCDGTAKIGQKRPGGSCSEADSSSSFGWLVAWLAGSAGSGSSSGSSSNSQNSQTGASPSSPAAIYIGSNHAATPTASSRRYDSSSNGLYPPFTHAHLSASLAFFSGSIFQPRVEQDNTRWELVADEFSKIGSGGEIIERAYVRKCRLRYYLYISEYGPNTGIYSFVNKSTSWMAFFNIACYFV